MRFNKNKALITDLVCVAVHSNQVLIGLFDTYFLKASPLDRLIFDAVYMAVGYSLFYCLLLVVQLLKTHIAQSM